MSLSIVPVLRGGKLVHLVPKMDGQWWDRTLCNVTLTNDWRELTLEAAAKTGVCPNCAHRSGWLWDLFEWMQVRYEVPGPLN